MGELDGSWRRAACEEAGEEAGKETGEEGSGSTERVRWLISVGGVEAVDPGMPVGGVETVGIDGVRVYVCVCVVYVVWPSTWHGGKGSLNAITTTLFQAVFFYR